MTHFSSKSVFKFIIPALIVVGSFALLHSRLYHIDALATADQFPWALETAHVTSGTVRDVFPALGYVESASELKIAPQISGTVLAAGPRGGAHVKKGDLLVHIDTGELEANLDALKSQLISAQNTATHAAKEYEREKKLLAEGGSSQSALEGRETQMKAAKAELYSLQDQIKALEIKTSYGHIYAPADANVIERRIDKGDTVFPGKTAYILSINEGGLVVIPVPLETLERVKRGGAVELRHGGDTLNLKISRINPALDKFAMGSLEIDTPARSFGLPDAAPVSAFVITASIQNSLLVPNEALVPSDNKTDRTVYKIVGGKLVKTPVTLKLCGVEGCAIESQSLHAGDVVARGHGSVLLKLRDGDPVMPTANNGAKK